MKTTIIDCGGLFHSNFFVSNNQKDMNISEKYAFWRFLNLNIIRKIRNKFKPDELILACDNFSWRRNYFKFYKANRLKKREESDIDWKMFYAEIQTFLNEIRENFEAYNVIEIEGAEADDIIAIITNGLRSIREKIIIISRDKDFKQLIGRNVLLYDPINQKNIECKSPKEYLLKQILMGDSADGIPNIRSDDDTFITDNKRQKPFGPKTITKVLISGLEEYIIQENLERNYERNKKLISLSSEVIPKKIQKKIYIEYKKNRNKKNNFMKVQKYLLKHKFRSLVDKIDHFL